jgi:hypothetical protein
MILAEALLLIALDDDKGNDESTWGSDPGLAGALLLDLVRGGHAVEDGKQLAAGPVAPEHPTLALAHDAMAQDGKARRPDGWIGRLPSRLKPLRETVARPLTEAGILTEERRKRLGLFETVRFPTADPGPERELRAGLHDVLVTGREPTEDEALLLSLLVPLDLVRLVVGKDDRRAAKARAKEVAARTPSGDAVKRSIDGIQTAVVVAATTAATTASVSSS